MGAAGFDPDMFDAGTLQILMRRLDTVMQAVLGPDSDPKQPQLLVDRGWIGQFAIVAVGGFRSPTAGLKSPMRVKSSR